MRYEKMMISAVVALLLSLALGAAAATDARPEVKLLDLKRHAVSLKQYRGKIVVLNFWATWCTGCKEEIPLLIEEQGRYANRGVQVIGAALDDATTVDQVGPYAKQSKFNFPVWIGATVDDLDRLGLGQAVPDTLFMDREGNVTGRVMGVLGKEELEQRLEWLLGNHQGEEPPPVVNKFSAK